jgi:hypothetical protein
MRIAVLPQESLRGTIALLWLTTRKQPGKFCRMRQFPADGVNAALPRYRKISSEINLLNSNARLARRSHRKWRTARHGSVAQVQRFPGE